MNDQPTGDSPLEERHRRAREISRRKVVWFLANILSVLVASGSALLSFFTAQFLEKKFDFELPEVHWMVLVVALNAIYVAASYVVALNGRGSLLVLIFRIPSWAELRNFGDQRIAKVSYVALIAIPLAAYFIVDNPLQFELLRGTKLPLNTKISFFIAFFFSVALLMFAVGCPKEIHRKPPFEGVQTVNLVVTSVDRSIINLRDEDDLFDVEIDSSKLELRAFCWLFYTLGLVLSVVLLLRSALFVLNA